MNDAELDWISHIVAHSLHISERGRDTDRLLLVALAMLLGHDRLVVTADAQSSVEAARYILSRARNDGGSRYLGSRYLRMTNEELLDRLDSVLVIFRSAVDPDELRRRGNLNLSSVPDLAEYWVGMAVLSRQQEDEYWKHPGFHRILELNITVRTSVRIGIDSLPLPTHSSHLLSSTDSFLWLPRYLEVLGATVGMTQIPVTESDTSKGTLELWNTAANAFLLMSSSSFSSDQAGVVAVGHSTLINTIRWAVSVVTTQNWERDPESELDSELESELEVLRLHRLQSATLCLLHSPLLTSLIPMEQLQDTLLRQSILDLLNHLSNQDPYQYPQDVSHQLSWPDHPDVARAITAVDIIRGILRIEGGGRLKDLQADEEWSVDPSSDPILRAWIRIIEGWLFYSNPRGPDLPPDMISLFSTNLLLRCKMLRQPQEWLATLPNDTLSSHSVSAVAIAAVWSGWDAWKKSMDRSIEKRTTLIEYTLQILDSMPEPGWQYVNWWPVFNVRWCINEMLRISKDSQEEGLGQMQRALEAARDNVPIW